MSTREKSTPDYKDLTISHLLESEAALAAELEAARVEGQTWRRLALEAIHALHGATVKRERPSRIEGAS